VADLPGSGDGLVLVGEGADVALREVQRREIRRVPPELPEPIAEAHLVDAGDTARVDAFSQKAPVSGPATVVADPDTASEQIGGSRER
jgi:hypothetical protein